MMLAAVDWETVLRDPPHLCRHRPRAWWSLVAVGLTLRSGRAPQDRRCRRCHATTRRWRATSRSGDVTVVAPELEIEPELDRPEPAASRLARLRGRLARSQGIGKGLLSLLSRDKLDEATWDEIEETLLVADVGVGPTTELVGEPAHQGPLTCPTAAPTTYAGCSARSCSPWSARTPTARWPPAPTAGRPSCSWSGSTAPARPRPSASSRGCSSPTVGPCCSARPTRSAPRLPTSWRPGASGSVRRSCAVPRRGDPASVAFDAVQQGIDGGYDVVLLDTAGRLQNKVGLMDELGKVKRVVEKHGPVDEVLLVLDATTGQNGMIQARVFSEVVDVTGIVLTKLDGTAKGGIVVAVQRELGVPVKLVGLGEGPDDLAPFEPGAFVDALIDG